MKHSPYFLSFLPCLFLFINCRKIDIPVSDLIYNLNITQKSILADGTTIDTISVEMSSKAAISKRYVVFQTSAGNFINGTNGTITVPANYENNKVIAKAYFLAPLKPGIAKISVSPKLDSTIREFILTDSITALPSEATSIQVEPSAFGVQTNFQNEIIVTGVLKNANGNPVSIGTSVQFDDSIEGSISLKGKFRLPNDKSDSNSKVNAIYSVPNIPVGTNIKLKITLWKALNELSDIKDSTIITVIP